MDSGDAVAVLKELQTTNRFILKRLNNAQRKETTGPSDSSVDYTTVCCQQKQNEEEITALKRRLHILEEKDKETNSIVDRLCLLVEDLQKQLEESKNAQSRTSEVTSPTPGSDKTPQAKTEPVVPPHLPELAQKKPTDHGDLQNSQSNVSSERVVASVQPQQREANNDGSRTNGTRPEDHQVRPEPSETVTPVSAEWTMKPTQLGGYRLGDGSTPSVRVEIPGGPSSRPVIKQTEKKYLKDETHYQLISVLGLEQGLSDLGGAHTVFILDISASMAENGGWEQTQHFFFTFLNELDKVKSKMSEEEHVAVVVFGHETKTLQHFTNNYALLKRLVGEITLGGPSPLNGGIHVAIAAASTSTIHHVTINGFPVFTRIIVITDGRPTEPLLNQGPDLVDQTADDMTLDVICAQLTELENSPTSIILVPVGTPDMDFLTRLAGIEGVTLAGHFDAKKLARRTMLVSEHSPMDLSGIAEADKAHFEELRQEFHKYTLIKSITDSRWYLETADPKQPPVGSRVERGPDWKWSNQDGGGPGTIIGHCPGRVWVDWDRCSPNVYRYGQGKFDVLLIDTYRKPDGDKLNVGCLVRPGRQWKGDDAFDETGVVIRMEPPSHKLHVRWKSGKRGDYSHGRDGIFEVEPSRQSTLCLERIKETKDFSTSEATSLDLSDVFGAVGVSSGVALGGVALGGIQDHLKFLMEKHGEHGIESLIQDNDGNSEGTSSPRPIKIAVKPSANTKKTKNKNKNSQ